MLLENVPCLFQYDFSVLVIFLFVFPPPPFSPLFPAAVPCPRSLRLPAGKRNCPLFSLEFLRLIFGEIIYDKRRKDDRRK